jgi:hypothetical protein
MANNKQRYINTKFWNDTYVSDLDPIEKLLFIYFLTNEHTNISGIYELPLKIMSVETGIELSMIHKILPRLKDKIIYNSGKVVIKNFIRHQETGSPNVRIGILNCLKELDRKFIEKLTKQGNFELPRYYCDTLSIPYVEGRNYSDSNLDSDSNLHVDKSTSNKSVSRVKFTEKDLELSKLLLELIIKNNPTFKEPNLDGWANHIRLMREQDNRTEQQIEFLIKWCQKDTFWQANILSTKKLREKFDTLVAQVKRSADKDKIKKDNIAFV